MIINRLLTLTNTVARVSLTKKLMQFLTIAAIPNI